MKFEIASVVLSAIFATVHAQHTCGGDGEITFRGSTTVFPVTQKCGVKYTSICPGVKVVGNGTGSSSGVRAACGGRTTGTPESGTDIGNSSREFVKDNAEVIPDPTIAGKYKCVIGTQREIFRLPVAIDGLTIIISRIGKVNTDCMDKVPEGLTGDQLRWIFSNLTTLEATIGLADGNPATKKWNELSTQCPSQDIKAIGPATGFGTHDFFKEILFTNGDNFRSDFKTFPDNSDVLRDNVINTPWSIGFLGYSYYDANDSALKAVPVNGVTPSKASLEGFLYTLFSRRIYSLYWNDDASLAKTKCFSDFVYTKSGTIQVEGTGFLPVPEAERDVTKDILPGSCPQPGTTKAPKSKPTRAPRCRCFFMFRLFGLCCR